jgi:serine/threonine protein kinase
MMENLTGRWLAERYNLLQFLGRGSIGDVYKAWDRQRAINLSVKLLELDLAEDKLFLSNFQRDSQALIRLQHPYIVSFYGLEQADGLVFLLMDYIEGSTLAREISPVKGPFSMVQAMHILRPVCAALHYAHQMGVVHGNLKLANILIHNKGNVLVTDVGLKPLVEVASSSSKYIPGTPAYMAPEQIQGQSPTPQSDIYALGIVLYEMLSGGKRPFEGEHAEISGSTDERISWEQVNLAPPMLRRYNPIVPANVELAVMCCLEKQPEQRFKTTVDLLDALEGSYQVPARSKRVGKKKPSQLPINPNPTDLENPTAPPLSSPALSPDQTVTLPENLNNSAQPMPVHPADDLIPTAHKKRVRPPSNSPALSKKNTETVPATPQPPIIVLPEESLENYTPSIPEQPDLSPENLQPVISEESVQPTDSPKPMPIGKKRKKNKKDMRLATIVRYGSYFGFVALVVIVGWLSMRSRPSQVPENVAVAEVNTSTWTVQPDPPTSPPSTITVPVQTEQIILETVLVKDGALNYQLPDQEPQFVPAGSQSPVGTDVLLWTNTSTARLQLVDGSLISIDQFTKFSLQAPTDASSAADNTKTVFLESGSIYVVSANLRVKSKDNQFQAYVNKAQMGVRYGFSQNTFEVSCFGQQGTCQVQSSAGNSQLMPGQKIDFQGKIASQVEVADCKAWDSLSSTVCVVPASTPTAETSKETPTPVPTNTATPTSTSTVQNLNSGGREDGHRGEGGGSGGSGSGGGG